MQFVFHVENNYEHANLTNNYQHANSEENFESYKESTKISEIAIG